MLRPIDAVSLDSRLTDLGRTVECAGSRRTSSKVRASSATLNIIFTTLYKKSII
jgi:hypothetical protein